MGVCVPSPSSHARLFLYLRWTLFWGMQLCPSWYVSLTLSSCKFVSILIIGMLSAITKHCTQMLKPQRNVSLHVGSNQGIVPPQLAGSVPQQSLVNDYLVNIYWRPSCAGLDLGTWDRHWPERNKVCLHGACIWALPSFSHGSKMVAPVLGIILNKKIPHIYRASPPLCVLIRNHKVFPFNLINQNLTYFSLNQFLERRNFFPHLS